MDLLVGMWDGKVRSPHGFSHYTHVGYDDHQLYANRGKVAEDSGE